MFSSFVQLVSHWIPTPQIPGILRLADVEHLVHAAGPHHVRLNNLETSGWSERLEASSMPTAAFFQQWLTGHEQ
jgi:hypothetical protein